MIHCNNVRQAAKVVSMREETLPDPWEAKDVIEATGIDMRAALSAAMILSASSTEVSAPSFPQNTAMCSLQFDCPLASTAFQENHASHIWP